MDRAEVPGESDKHLPGVSASLLDRIMKDGSGCRQPAYAEPAVRAFCFAARPTRLATLGDLVALAVALVGALDPDRGAGTD